MVAVEKTKCMIQLIHLFHLLITLLETLAKLTNFVSEMGLVSKLQLPMRNNDVI